MPKIISIHSFRRGTGKSNLAANIAVLLASEGWRVGIIDDIQSPSIHFLFGLREGEITYSLNDHLLGKCSIKQAAYNVTPRLLAGSTSPVGATQGRLFLVPSSTSPHEIVRIQRKGYDADLLSNSLNELIEELALDVVVVDTYAGLNEETLGLIASSDTLVVLMRLDQQDYQGTGLVIEVAHRLSVPRIVLVVNEAPSGLDLSKAQTQVEQAYECEVTAVLPHSDEMMALASASIFVLRYPNHPVTGLLRQVAARLIA